MEIEKLIKHMRKEAQDYRAGRTLGHAFADAEDVLDEAATALEQLQAENGRFKRERDAAVKDLGKIKSCKVCKHCDSLKTLISKICKECTHGSNWEWRGIKED